MSIWHVVYTRTLIHHFEKKNGSLIREIIPKLPHFHRFKKKCAHCEKNFEITSGKMRREVKRCSKENCPSDSPTLKVRHLLGSVGEREPDIILRAALLTFAIVLL